MAIVSSSYTLEAALPNGARRVYERHTDSTGKVYESHYGPAPADTDYAAVLSAHAANLAEQLERAEFEAMIRGA